MTGYNDETRIRLDKNKQMTDAIDKASKHIQYGTFSIEFTVRKGSVVKAVVTDKQEQIIIE